MLSPLLREEGGGGCSVSQQGVRVEGRSPQTRVPVVREPWRPHDGGEGGSRGSGVPGHGQGLGLGEEDILDEETAGSGLAASTALGETPKVHAGVAAAGLEGLEYNFNGSVWSFFNFILYFRSKCRRSKKPVINC